MDQEYLPAAQLLLCTWREPVRDRSKKCRQWNPL